VAIVACPVVLVKSSVENQIKQVQKILKSVTWLVFLNNILSNSKSHDGFFRKKLSKMILGYDFHWNKL